MDRKAIPRRRLARITRRARGSGSSVAAAVPVQQSYTRGEAAAAMGSPANGEAERRRSVRVATSSEVLIRRVGAFNFSVPLSDISIGGCRVEMLEPTEPGDALVARLPQLQPLGSCVRWSEGTTAGVEFVTAIHPAVFDMLLTRLDPAAQD